MYLYTRIVQGKNQNLVSAAKAPHDAFAFMSSLVVPKFCQHSLRKIPSLVANNVLPKQLLLSLSLIASLLLPYEPVSGQENESGSYISEEKFVKDNPNLSYEIELLAQHAAIAANYNKNYDSLKQVKQPANKIEKCSISSDLLDPILSTNSMVFWEGTCKNNQAEGFGRVYIISSGRKVFEMLANFNSEDNNLTTTYYTKNTKIDSRTIYFYGKSNRYQSSGIFITQSKVDNDLLVGMQTVDKVNLVTYQKETSKNSKYVLNIKDYGNFVHFIHDLIHTPYRSLSMSYRLTNRTNNTNCGYSFTGQIDGSIVGNYVDQKNQSTQVAVPIDILEHVMNLNREIDINVEGALKNVIEAIPVVDAYKNVVCSESYQNPTCSKMRCKEICDLQNEIIPDHTGVKELLLRLVNHHNSKPLVAYLDKAKNLLASGNLNPDNKPQNNEIASSSNNASTEQQYRAPLDSSYGSTIEQAYSFSNTQNTNAFSQEQALDAFTNDNSNMSTETIRQGGLSFGNQVDVDNTARSQLYEAKGPSLSQDNYHKPAPSKDKDDIRNQAPNLAPNRLERSDNLSQADQAKAQKELQEKINREKAIREAQAAEKKKKNALKKSTVRKS